MGKILLLLFITLNSTAWADAYCAKTIDHDSPDLKQVAAIVSRSSAFQRIVKRNPEAMFCTSGVALEYNDLVAKDVFLFEIAVRNEGKMRTIELVRILVDGPDISLLKFEESTMAIRKWISAMTFKSAGVLPRIDATDIAIRLNVFNNSKADPETLTSISLRFPATQSEVYSLVTWAAEAPGVSMIGERVAGAVIVQDEITGDVAVASRMNLSELLDKLRTLKFR